MGIPSPRPTPSPTLSPLFEEDGDADVVGDELAEVGEGEAGDVAAEVGEDVVATAVEEEEAAFCEMLK